jgi:hypothetical protein
VQKPSDYAQHAPLINYRYLSDAVDYYKGKGYRYVEAPWFVTPEAINVTKPDKARTFETFAGHLVASGEQSFIDMRGELCPGRKFMCVTPCFRDEPKHDSQHLRCFIKCELIIPLWKDDNPDTFLEVLLKDAQVWLGRYGVFKIVVTKEGKDIFLGDVEVGSYGYRQFKDFRWVYGTGVAEPRLSQAIDCLKVKSEKE